MMEKLYTVEEVAELASVTGRTIRNYLKSGRLVGRKIGGQWRFPETEVQRLLTGAEPESDWQEETPQTHAEDAPVFESPSSDEYHSESLPNFTPPPSEPSAPVQQNAVPPSEDAEDNWDRSWDRDVVYLPDRRATPRVPGTTRAVQNNNSGSPYPTPAPLPVAPGQRAQPQQGSRQYDGTAERNGLTPQGGIPQGGSEFSHHSYASVPPAVPPYSGMEQPRHPTEPYRETTIEPVYTGPTSFGMPIIASVPPAAPPPAQMPLSETAAFASSQMPVQPMPTAPAPEGNNASANMPPASGLPASFPGVVIPYGYQLVPIQAMPPAYYATMAAPPLPPSAAQPSPAPILAPAQPPIAAPSLPKEESEVPISALSDVAKRVMRFASEVHDCTAGPQICTIVDMQQSLESAKITSERLSGIARQESEHGLPCQCFVEYDERYFVARYTLFGTSLFLSRCLKLIG